MTIQKSQAPGRKTPVPSGLLIAVEGLDGSGKSTQLYLLKRWLELEGYRVFLSEWNSSVIVKQATKKGKKRQLLTPTTFSLIHCADFADRYEMQIEPLLRAGHIVLCDRFIYTAFVRDAVRKCDTRWVRNLYNFAREPDITFFFKVPLNTALDRILAGRPKLKYHEAGMDMGFSPDPYESFRLFQGRINDEYLKLADEYRFIIIDATQTIEQQQDQVRHKVVERVDLAKYRIR